MNDSSRAAAGRNVLFTPRNLALIAVALVTIGAGYAVLSQGSASAAAVLLVIGYVVLLPMALVL